MAERLSLVMTMDLERIMKGQLNHMTSLFDDSIRLNTSIISKLLHVMSYYCMVGKAKRLLHMTQNDIERIIKQHLNHMT